MSTTFKRPLIVNTKDRPFKSGVFDLKAVREGYERLGGNPFNIRPDTPQASAIFDCSTCGRYEDRERGVSVGSCNGGCGIG